MILTKLGQHVNETMAVVVNDFRIFDGHVFLSDKTLTWPLIPKCLFTTYQYQFHVMCSTLKVLGNKEIKLFNRNLS